VVEKCFVYCGLTFRPLGNLNKKESDFFAISKRIKDVKITPKNWDYEKFYKAAKTNNSYVDLFEVNGITVIPTRERLFQYQG
jgi:hypothetical protein